MQKKTPQIRLGLYRHYKGLDYEVIGVANHSESLEEMIVYKALYDAEPFGKNALWVRPCKMFFENVIVDGKEVPRFEFVKER